MTSEMGSEFELPKTWECQLGTTIVEGMEWQHTAMATTKFLGRFPNPYRRETARAVRYETSNCTTKIKGMTPSSTSLEAVSWDASFVKT
jgi:hypothetical protein